MAWKIESKIVRKVATIDEGRSTLDAAILMTEEFIGAVVVTNAVGIVFENKNAIRADFQLVKIKDSSQLK